MDALPRGHRAVAFDLPGHGGSAAVPDHRIGSVVDAIRQGVIDADLEPPIVVGHSLGGQLATHYAASHPAVAVVSVAAPVRLETFAQLLRSLRSQLTGDGFGEAWAIYQDSRHVELLPAADRALLGGAERRGDNAVRQLVLNYQSDLLQRPLAEILRERDEGLGRLRAAGIPYLTVHACPLDPSDAAWLHERLPQADIVVWPVGHHFPHLAHPARFAALLCGLAAGRARGPRLTPQHRTNRSNDYHQGRKLK
jgi:pimeloyl-ACP methyl ester carboxylesterase